MNIFIIVDINLLNISRFNISVNILLDWISCIFLRTVTFISAIILIFRIYYIPKKEQNIFTILIIIFVLSIRVLILRNNIFLILLGWDGLGLSSYILVIYYQNYSTAASGTITLISNRIGDIFILLSIGLLLIIKTWNFNINENFSILTLLILIIAACSKRAQYPFRAWLPIAIAAPTPISALVHSSTLVTAGVFIIIRIINNIHPTRIILLILISTRTALYASISACWEQDLKKIIALSTLRQIAIIIFAISINSLNRTFSHLIIHALFKSLIFICAGIIIHESSYQDTRIIGIIISRIPLTSSIIGISAIALIGLPFTSGFFSKDIIIEIIIRSNLKCILTMLIIASIGMTIFYSIRIIILSNKILIKSKPFNENHFSNYYNITIIVIRLLTIISGPIIFWIINSDQILFFPKYFKILILTTIVISFLTSISLSLNTKSFLNMGNKAISLWFNHTIFTHPTIISFPVIILFKKNDQTWQELYGPNKIYNNLIHLSNYIELYKYSLIILLLIITLIITLINIIY